MSSPCCANCRALLTGPYCSTCGQAAHVGRLHVHDLLHDTWHALTHADKGILRLSKELATRPRQVYLNYFAGQRRTYFSPVLYFLLFAGALAVLYPYVFDYDDYVNHTRNEFGRELYHLIKYRALALLPVQVLLTWLMFRRQYNLSETTVFWLFCLGFTYVVRLLLLPLYFLFIQHKPLLDILFGYLTVGLILWHLLMVFARHRWGHKWYVIGLVVGLLFVDTTIQGYLLYGSTLWQQPEFNTLSHILRTTFL